MKSTKSFALRRPNLFMRLVSGTRSSLKLQMKKFATSLRALLDPSAVCGFANALYLHVLVGPAIKPCGTNPWHFCCRVTVSINQENTVFHTRIPAEIPGRSVCRNPYTCPVEMTY